MLVLGDVTSNVRNMLDAGEIDSEAVVGELFGKVPPARCVHVVVTVPGRDALPGILGKNRVQGHWNDMNCVFRHLKPSPDKPVSLNTLCWDDVSWLYRWKHHEEMARTVSDDCFQHVKTKLNEAINAVSGVNTSWILFALFMGIVSTSARRMKIYGNRYFENPDGRFDVGGEVDFVLGSRSHSVCVMDSRKAVQNVSETCDEDDEENQSYDYAQEREVGLAQTVLAMELLNAHGEGKVVTGIVSDCYSWTFVRLEYTNDDSRPMILTDEDHLERRFH